MRWWNLVISIFRVQSSIKLPPLKLYPLLFRAWEEMICMVMKSNSESGVSAVAWKLFSKWVMTPGKLSIKKNIMTSWWCGWWGKTQISISVHYVSSVWISFLIKLFIWLSIKFALMWCEEINKMTSLSFSLSLPLSLSLSLPLSLYLSLFLSHSLSFSLSLYFNDIMLCLCCLM